MKNTQHDEAQKSVTSAHCVVQTFHKVHTVHAVIKSNQPVIYSDIISSYLDIW